MKAALGGITTVVPSTYSTFYSTEVTTRVTSLLWRRDQPFLLGYRKMKRTVSTTVVSEVWSAHITKIDSCSLHSRATIDRPSVEDSIWPHYTVPCPPCVTPCGIRCATTSPHLPHSRADAALTPPAAPSLLSLPPWLPLLPLLPPLSAGPQSLNRSSGTSHRL